MVYPAAVVRVAIASPADVADARDAVEQALHSWNDAHGQRRGISLQPWRWETGSVPVLGGEPQALINSQGMDRADIVFALFGSRLGSPTSSAVSGTVEEIERAVAHGKPVHLFFSTAELPRDVDTAQLEGLRAFRAEIQSRGLYGEYHNPTELAVRVWQAVEHDLDSIHTDPSVVASTVEEPVTFRVQQHSDGRDRFLGITNRSSTTDAENVTVSQHGDWAGRVLADWGDGTTIHAEQTRRVAVIYFMGGGSGDQPAIDLTWDANGETRTKTYFF